MDEPLIQEKRETVGKISSELLAKQPESRDPIEIAREMTKGYMDDLTNCVLESRKHYNKDFYVVGILKKERLMPNVLPHKFRARISCPTPQYDETVYKYNHVSENIEFMWTIPDKETSLMLWLHADKIHPDERELLGYVMAMYDGSLLRMVKKLNNELN